jgi:N-acetylmuramoyl-L-alanine amidase
MLAALALLALCRLDARAGDTDDLAGPARHATACTRAASFRTVVDIGHAADAPGARSAHGTYEYDFNYRLAQEIDKALRAAGFDKTVLLVTAEAPTAGLFKRVARANAMKADLFLAVHHDAVPDNLIHTWQFEGREEQYNDDFPGHSIFISSLNADRAGSLAFARLLGLALKARGLKYTPHYTEKFMGNRRRELVDAQAGVYRFDQLVVLKNTKMPAALLESGSIVNRSEDLLLATSEHQAIVAAAVVDAVDAFCSARAKPRPAPAPVAAKKP